MTYDELISDYVDGQLSERERTAFEERLLDDTSLKRNTNATRFTIYAAQQLPTATPPRSFALPASMAQPERAHFDWRFVFRIGSAIAAALFVVLVGLDLSSLLPRQIVLPVPREAPQPTLRIAQVNTESAILPSAASTQFNVIELTQITGLPQARATKSLNTLNKLTPTMIATAIPTTLQTAIELTPMPTLASVVPSDVSTVWTTWPRLLAGAILLLGAGLAILGWRR